MQSANLELSDTFATTAVSLPFFALPPSSFTSPSSARSLSTSRSSHTLSRSHDSRLPHLHRLPFVSRTHPRATASHPDVVIIGAGATGLSTAFHLARRGASIRLLTAPSRRPAALAAAGMLAPDSEALPQPLLDMCRASRALYPSFIAALQQTVPNAPDLYYRAIDDFLIPLFDGASPPSLPSDADTAFLSTQATRVIEPALSESITSVIHVRRDASIDNRRLHAVLREACETLGIRVEQTPVRAIFPTSESAAPTVVLDNSNGRHSSIQAGHVVVAAGAWTRSLLPNIPVAPIKGQMLSLSLPPGVPPPSDALQHTIHTPELYIVPKDSGGRHYFVGATVEPSAAFSTTVTAGGISKLLEGALRIIPAFQNYEIVETWAGLRPGTPDGSPLLGLTDIPNVSIASGMHRNGILLAPIAGDIMAAVALGETERLPADWQSFIEAFSPSRFTGENNQPSGKTVPQQSYSSSVPTKTAQSETTVERRRTNAAGHSAMFDAAPDARVYRVLKDGTKEAIEPPENWRLSPESLERAKAPTTDSNNSPLPETQQASVAKDSQVVSTDVRNQPILVYKVLEDGSREPIKPPPGWTPSSPQLAQHGLPNSTPEVTASQPEQSFVYTQHVEKPENVSAINDAYDDVLAKRGEGAEEQEKRARAANRGFGRTPSRLETEGSPVLSLSAEDVKIFDAAYEAGLEDMKQFAERFNDSDPSVLATKQDLSEIAKASTSSDLNETDDDEAGDDVVGVTRGREQTGIEGRLSTDGYY